MTELKSGRAHRRVASVLAMAGAIAVAGAVVEAAPGWAGGGGSDFDAQQVGSGIVVTGTESFTVGKGTRFFVRFANASDGRPVLGADPTTPAEATSSISVDGTQHADRARLHRGRR